MLNVVSNNELADNFEGFSVGICRILIKQHQQHFKCGFILYLLRCLSVYQAVFGLSLHFKLDCKGCFVLFIIILYWSCD